MIELLSGYCALYRTDAALPPIMAPPPLEHIPDANMYVTVKERRMEDIYSSRLELFKLKHLKKIINVSREEKRVFLLRQIDEGLDNEAKIDELNFTRTVIPDKDTISVISESVLTCLSYKPVENRHFIENFQIKVLNLSQNDIVASDLSHLEKLFKTVEVKLHHLILSNNKLGPKGAEDLLKILRCLPHLQELNIKSNDIGNKGIGQILTVLKETNSLTALNVSDNNLGNVACEYIEAYLTGVQNCKLNTLDISYNKIERKGFARIVDSQKKTLVLSKVYIGGNKISAKPIRELLELFNTKNREHACALSLRDTKTELKTLVDIIKITVSKTAYLTTLDLANSNLAHEDCKIVCESLRNNSSIVRLNLDQCNFDLKSANSLLQSMTKNNTLTALSLKNNNMKSETIHYVADMLKRTKSLSKFSIGGNFIKAEKDMKIFCDSLLFNIALLELDLAQMNISAEGVKCLAQALVKNNTLEKLVLDSNKIGDQGCKYLNAVLKTNTSLKQLFLRDNYITEIGAESLIDGLEYNTGMVLLNISHNRIKDKNEIAKKKNSIPTLADVHI